MRFLYAQFTYTRYSFLFEEILPISSNFLTYNETEDVPHFCKWGYNIPEQVVSISPASLKRQLEDFAYGKI